MDKNSLAHTWGKVSTISYFHKYLGEKVYNQIKEYIEPFKGE